MIQVSIDPKTMKSAVSDLVDRLKNKIDLNYLKTICQEQYGIETIEGIEHKAGDVVVIKDEIACRLDFEVRFPMSVFITNGEKRTSKLSQEDGEEVKFEEIELDEIDEEDQSELPSIDNM